jgi:hypothetical protein
MESILLAASEGTKKGEMFRPSPLAASLLSQEVPPPNRPFPVLRLINENTHTHTHTR